MSDMDTDKREKRQQEDRSNEMLKCSDPTRLRRRQAVKLFVLDRISPSSREKIQLKKEQMTGADKMFAV